MSKIIKEITVISGQYKNKDGVQKNRYQKIGSIIETKNGPMLKLDSMPLLDGGWNGWAYINEPYAENKEPAKAGSGFDDMPNDMPF
jgi:hypothetical protein